MYLVTMLASRFQAVRYRNPGLMMLLLRLVLRSSEAFDSIRYGENSQPCPSELDKIGQYTPFSPRGPLLVVDVRI